MIKLENFEVMGWEHVIRGMRNPMNSWEKSDSNFDCKSCDDCYYANESNMDETEDDIAFWCNHTALRIGPNDHSLMMKLRNAGTDHRKFMRMITVYVDITAPLYWWKEFDTYKVGTVANSCSTMHKIHEKEFTLEDFSCEKLIDGIVFAKNPKGIDEKSKVATNPLNVMRGVIDSLNTCRLAYLEHKDDGYHAELIKDIWHQMIQLLPSSYNQKRTVMLNYEVLANIYKSRRNHKLDEWKDFCKWIETLPYSELMHPSTSVIPICKELMDEAKKRVRETSFQEDLDFFVSDCTNAQLEQLYEVVGEKIKEKGL